jgi:ribonuclease HI
MGPNINKTHKIALDRLNRLACLSLGSVIKGTPTRGLEIIYDLWPLHLEIEKIAINTMDRISNSSPAGWISIIQKRGHIQHWIHKKSSYGLAATNDTDKISPIMIWDKNFKIPNFNLTKNVTIEPYKDIICHTDGSKLDGKAGFGYVITHRLHKVKQGSVGIGSRASVFQAEIMAITEVCIALKNRIGKKITIRSDSQSAILAVGATIITTKTALTCREALNHLGALNEVNLTWIKAHVGHKGNELADKLAKNGTLKSTIRSCPVGLAQIKFTTKQAILKV